MSLSKELLNRLVCAKYIFRKGAEILERGEPFASGISIIHFQDAAEMALRVIAENFHCSIKENSAFNNYTPVVHFSDAGTYEVIHGVSGKPIDPTRDIAIFCLRFAIDAILLIKNNRLPSVYPRQEPKRRFKVLKRSPIIVWPSEDIEIIRYAEVGETLLARYEKYDTPEYVAIIQDGDDAFVKKSGVTSSD